MKINKLLAGVGVCLLVAGGTYLIIRSVTGKDNQDEEKPSSVSSSISSEAEGSSSEIPDSIQTSDTSVDETTVSSLPETLPSEEGVDYIDAVFLGVNDYGADQTKKENASSFYYRFRVNGAEQLLAIDNSSLDENGKPAYPIQNKLKEGYAYTLSVKDNIIIDVRELPCEDEISYHPVVSGNPGERTVMNFIKTSLMPVGTSLYVFGGGWDWQDTGSAIQARTLGVSDDWVRFFNQQDENYTFRDVDNDPSKRDPKTSYYPFGGFNEYYYAGLDCSGFVGWVTYNTFETENGRPGYVCSSTKMAKRMADEYGWGAFSKEAAPTAKNKLLPGDVVSMKGHVWISLGTCADGSVVIVHSTNGYVSRKGQPGGGVAIGAIGRSKECEAYKLADYYMSTFYPEWYRRYSVSLSDPDKYYNMEADTAGRFTWDTSSPQGLSDDLGAQDMTPEQILKYCFGEK